MRKLILMRGVSGSGKSTLARQLAQQHPEAVIFSTDDYFVVGGVYRFDPGTVADNHNKNFKRAVMAMKEDTPLIIIDNTHTRAWEMVMYVLDAKAHGYQVEIHQPDPVSVDEIMRRQESRRERGKCLSRAVVEAQLGRFEHDVTVEQLIERASGGPGASE